MLFVNLLFIFPYCIDKLINNERHAHGGMTIEVRCFTFTQCNKQHIISCQLPATHWSTSHLLLL